MDEPAAPSWTNTTHDWASTVDLDHLARIRRVPQAFAPGGPAHLILEVVAYAADEASHRAGGRCRVTLHRDGSVSVADDGRGTDTRVDVHGRTVKKPVMASKDLRFFDLPDAERLPDGHPRRGMSVVAALSEWLVHTNRRHHGAWTQRYEHGVPVSDLDPIDTDGTTGTLVHFLPLTPLRTQSPPASDDLTRWCAHWPALAVRLEDERGLAP
ncbi:ATP-binding protein [Streptomyces sp. AK04-3B]|uniref:ATP-binding protein n=1 Tax=Streptomyces sp. AK04-3B TaxID=3028650 RepID=UPI0029A84279|nr:ATP-binding protein [Streptomyces sp. AK04-3B]MDX3799316.1 ATP-binding protein [Streptomyces sp. AK04-3B]